MTKFVGEPCLNKTSTTSLFTYLLLQQNILTVQSCLEVGKFPILFVQLLFVWDVNCALARQSIVLIEAFILEILLLPTKILCIISELFHSPLWLSRTRLINGSHPVTCAEPTNIFTSSPIYTIDTRLHTIHPLPTLSTHDKIANMADVQPKKEEDIMVQDEEEEEEDGEEVCAIILGGRTRVDFATAG